MAIFPDCFLKTKRDVADFTKSAWETFIDVNEVVKNLPKITHTILFNPQNKKLHVAASPSASDEDVEKWRKAGLPPIPRDVLPEGLGHEPWMVLHRSADPVASTFASLLNIKPWFGNKLIGGPNPLLATLSGSLLGGLAGYGVGSIFETPHGTTSKKQMGKYLGALLGALPGVVWGTVNLRELGPLRGLFSSWPFVEEEAEKKSSFTPAGHTGVLDVQSLPPLNKDKMIREVWSDPHTPYTIKVLTTGLLENASAVTGGRNRIYPHDIGAVSYDFNNGLIVGKTLTALHNVDHPDKRVIKEQGLWSKILSNVVPTAFPDHRLLFRTYP